eukprot:73006_1
MTESVHSNSSYSSHEEIDFEDIFTDSEDEDDRDYDDEKAISPPPKQPPTSSHRRRNNTHKHKWQWYTGSYWKDYALVDSQTIESQYGSANETHITYKTTEYQIDLANMHQINPETGKKRKIRRVPLHVGDNAKDTQSRPHMHPRKHTRHHSRHTSQTQSNAHKWQWYNGTQFVDYGRAISIGIEQCYKQQTKHYRYKNHQNKQSYTIKLDELKQYNDRSSMSRDIRRVSLHMKVVKHMKWQWLSGGKFVDYTKKKSIAIEAAYNNNMNGAGPKDYKFTNNKTSYSITFNAMKQINNKTKASRDVRRVTMDVKGEKPRKRPRQRTKDGWPNANTWRGPKPTKRRKVFGKKIMKLYHITDAASAKLIWQKHKMIRGSAGMFGGGIYFAETVQAAKHKAHKKGVLITAKVFVGKEKVVMNFNGGQFTFQSLQSTGYDSVNAPKGAGNGEAERVVYNFDQVCVIKQETCP